MQKSKTFLCLQHLSMDFQVSSIPSRSPPLKTSLWFRKSNCLNFIGFLRNNFNSQIMNCFCSIFYEECHALLEFFLHLFTAFFKLLVFNTLFFNLNNFIKHGLHLDFRTSRSFHLTHKAGFVET